MKSWRILVIVLASISSVAAWAAPAQVIIIRHGEKPKNGNQLSPRGFQRAQALVGFFEHNSAVTQYGTPVAIYAMEQNPNNDDDSVRAAETVTPLAQALGLQINESYPKDDYQPLVQEIMAAPAYAGRMVLICWEHSVIPMIAQAFGATQAPAEWPKAEFDRAWIIDFSGNRVVDFKNIPQDVLPGDSAQ
jgi:hypothetical protein